jgi:hypothetical protein
MQLTGNPILPRGSALAGLDKISTLTSESQTDVPSQHKSTVKFHGARLKGTLFAPFD